MLNEQELEEHLTKEMVAPTEGQPLRDHTAYQKWNQKDRSARYTLLSSLQNDLIGQYDELPTCKALWEQLKFSFSRTSTTRLCSLVIKFEEYTKDPKHTMSEHLRVMSNMIGKLRDVGHVLTDEQQVRAVIRLPFKRLSASLRPCAVSDENRKKLNETTSYTNSLLTSVALATQLLELLVSGVPMESPMKMATVKSAFTFTMASTAVTRTLVFLAHFEDEVEDSCLVGAVDLAGSSW
ncbi:hypothetical protein RJ640_025320 [Escallonia rubra]|uniref:UBN2_2 domain-containing protein n=1 Tax=Escallonia rubra TaxID=112253 RepID=A0AA88QJI5_9ASTE|nr:hypothetical protein RJ640_025320 [Escallonia rubra]